MDREIHEKNQYAGTLFWRGKVSCTRYSNHAHQRAILITSQNMNVPHDLHTRTALPFKVTCIACRRNFSVCCIF